MNVKEIIFGMLTENTGAHFLDSGGAYGRAWERNQGKTMADFEAEPDQQYTYHKSGNWLERRVSVFHYLSQLQTDWICDYFNAMPCGDWDADGEVYGVSQFQWDWLTNKCEVKVNYGFNTYNGDSDLSQILQGSWLTINDEPYLLLQVHGGCDARGGYTNAKLFQLNYEGMIHEYLREYMDSYETDEELREGYIDAVDSDDPSITYTSDQLIDMMTNHVSSKTQLLAESSVSDCQSSVADDTDIKMRSCTKCNASMNDGYVFRDGENYACSDDCRDAICKDDYDTTWVEEHGDESYFTEFNDD